MHTSPSDENTEKQPLLTEILAQQKKLHRQQATQPDAPDAETSPPDDALPLTPIPEPILSPTSSPATPSAPPSPLKNRFWRRQRSLMLATSLLAVLILVMLAQFIFWPSMVAKNDINSTPTAAQINFSPTSIPSDQAVPLPPQSQHPAPPVYAQAAYLFDVQTGVTLYTHNSNQHLPIMSTTKLMTALIVVEHTTNLDRNVVITDQIADDINEQTTWDSSLMGISHNESYSIRDLLYGLLLASGNDAAVALADTISGSTTKFVALMNQRAQQLGLRDTHFANPNGLPDDHHFSSAHDLALIGKISLNNPVIHTISQTRNYKIAANNAHEEHEMFNGNQFLWWYPGADGGKPGYDTEDNFVQVISVTRNQRQLIGVVIHTRDWWTDMRNLMNWGFDDFTWVSPRDLVNDNFIPYAAAYGYFADDKPENTIPTADKGRYYIYTGYSISPPIMNYFDQHGGLNTFGYPTSQTGNENVQTLTQTFSKGKITCNLKTNTCN